MRRPCGVRLFPSSFSLLHLAPRAAHISALLLTSTLSWASHSLNPTVRGRLVATEVFCDVVDSRSVHYPVIPPRSRCSRWRSLVTFNECSWPNRFNSASAVMAILEFELKAWQGHQIQSIVLVNKKYYSSQDEGWGDCVAKEGNQWFNVKSLRTDHRSGVNHPVLYKRKQKSASGETSWLHRNPHSVKGRSGVSWKSKQGMRTGKKMIQETNGLNVSQRYRWRLYTFLSHQVQPWKFRSIYLACKVYRPGERKHQGEAGWDTFLTQLLFFVNQSSARFDLSLVVFIRKRNHLGFARTPNQNQTCWSF